MNEIDARDFGKLEANVEALEKEVHALRADVRALLELANKSRGGLWTGMMMASLFGGFISFVVTRFFK